MRRAGLLARLAAAGQPVDRSGAGIVVEVIPRAALKHWGLTYRNYKGIPTPPTDVPAVRPCAGAVIAALNARAAALGPTTTPGAEQLDAARTKGWIALPVGDLADLIDNPYPTGRPQVPDRPS
jgi:hypothetical protein